MAQTDRHRDMLSRTQFLMAVVSLTPLAVLFWLSQRYVSETLRESGQISAFYSISAVLAFTAVAVILGYILVRRDTLRAIEAIGAGERRMNSLLDATGRIAALTEPQAVRTALVESAAELCSAQRAALWLRERDNMVVVAAVGMSEERARSQSIAIGHGLVGGCAGDGQVRSGTELGESDLGWDDRVLTKTESYLILPMELQGKVIGVLDIRNAQGEHSFGSIEQQLAEGLVRQAVLFLDNASFREANELFESAVGQLVEDITDTHLTWSGHVKAVQELSDKLAARMGLPQSRRDILQLAARVHDIGLVEFPNPEIGPPGGHVDHAAHGAERIRAMPGWSEAATTVRASHEQMDGRGPKGMHGFAIPMSGRILAFAEYFDTVTNPASPWGTLTLRDVIKELQAEPQERFDNKVVEAFLKEHADIVEELANEPVDLEEFEDVFEVQELEELPEDSTEGL